MQWALSIHRVQLARFFIREQRSIRRESEASVESVGSPSHEQEVVMPNVASDGRDTTSGLPRQYFVMWRRGF
jgi:hypothetical protein